MTIVKQMRLFDIYELTEMESSRRSDAILEENHNLTQIKTARILLTAQFFLLLLARLYFTQVRHCATVYT